MKTKTFKNGLKLVVEEVPSMESSIVGICVNVGSRYETPELQGVSHFIEHMVFKGTSSRSHADISKELEGIGGRLNAWTSNTQTFFHTRFVGNHTGTVLDILTDMLFNSKFNEKDIESEKKVVCEELKMYEDDSASHVDQLTDTMLYEKTSLEHSILGSINTITNYNRRKMYNYYVKHYRPDNMTIVAVGNIKYKDIVKKILQNENTTYYGLNVINRPKKIIKFKNTKSIIREYRKTEQSNIVIGIKGYGSNHKDFEILNLLTVILGGNMSSRLWETVREKHGLAYSVKAYLDVQEDIGLLKIFAGVSPKNTVRCITDIIDTIRKAKNDIIPEELQRAKNYLIGSLKMTYETIPGKTTMIVKGLLSEDKTSILKKINKYKKIEIKDINRVYKNIMKEESFVVSIIGPISPLTEQRLRDEFKFKE